MTLLPSPNNQPSPNKETSIMFTDSQSMSNIRIAINSEGYPMFKEDDAYGVHHFMTRKHLCTSYTRSPSIDVTDWFVLNDGGWWIKHVWFNGKVSWLKATSVQADTCWDQYERFWDEHDRREAKQPVFVDNYMD